MAPSDLTKKYYKIKDVAEIIGVPQSTLRYWEMEFPEVNPMRGTSNQRYYSIEDIQTLRIIHYLIKIKGLKIEAAKPQLRLNKLNISKRIEIIEKLNDVKDELNFMLEALSKRSN